MTYKAIITPVKVRPHPNADKLQLADVAGSTVVVGLETTDGELGVFFPTDGKLSPEYCSANDLYPVKDPETGERIGGGYFTLGKERVRSQRFRGEKSEGYWAPVSSLAYTGYDLSKLVAGFEFDELNGHKVCEKYYTPATLRAMKGGKLRRQNEWFLPHVDTEQLKWNLNKVVPGSLVTITLKMHGTCLIAKTKIRMWDGSVKRISKVRAGDLVVGFKDGKFIQSLVTDSFTTGKSSDWLTIKAKRRKLGQGNSFASITCTSDHLIYCNDSWVEAKDIKAGDVVTQPRKDLVLTQIQKSVLLGKILGDGTLSHRDGVSQIIEFRHSVKQEEYVDHTLSVLGNLGNPKKTYYTSGYGFPTVCGKTVFCAALGNLYGEFYQPNKQVPHWVAEKLDPISIAYWYMDDGSLAHTDKQRDRALFATNGFNEESIDILLAGLKNNGINGVKYNPGDGWRIRLNAKDAYVMFNLISPYVPECMKYKLPKEMRGQATVDISSNSSEGWILKEDLVTSVENANKKRTMKYDLTTDTGNFVANDILVHNSARISHVLDEVKVPRKWWQKLLRRPEQTRTEWAHLVGTRRTILRDPNDTVGGFYGDEAFRWKAVEDVLPHLRKGEIVYGELVGFLPDGRPIMGSQSTKEMKELKKQYGPTMTYSYGCAEGQCKFIVYRIAVITEDKHVVDYSWSQVKARASELGLETVPEFGATKPFPSPNTGSEADNDKILNDILRPHLLKECEDLAVGPDPTDPRHIREGVVVRLDQPSGKTEFFKLKSFDFGVLEGYLKQSDDYVDTEEIA